LPEALQVCHLGQDVEEQLVEQVLLGAQVIHFADVLQRQLQDAIFNNS
jgi:hypothetical protein